jgi:hypothetical protein
MRFAAVCFLLAHVGTAYGASPFDTSAGSSESARPRSADCSQLTLTQQRIPAWSRLQWSVRAGAAIDVSAGADARAVLLHQASYTVWAREWQCLPGTGFFTHKIWQRWSISGSLDAAWESDGAIDVRPALRVARSRYHRGLFSVGSEWLPSTELFVAIGPTFDARGQEWSGGALGIGGRLAVLDVELRYAAHPADRDHEVMLFVGITDVHGLWRLGPRRADAK